MSERLCLIADDLTGSLDTGAQFACSGRTVNVYPFPAWKSEPLIGDIVVMDTDSRHLLPQEAYRRVFDAAAIARAQGFSCAYKKTDSCLRGHIGAELNALLDAFGASELPFAPAYPAQGRTTVAGRQLLHGVPVEQTPLGQDPFSPVADSRILELIRREGMSEKIRILDAQSEADLSAWGKIYQNGPIWAGSAGFAAYLPMSAKEKTRIPVPVVGSFFVLCGSVQPLSLAQCETAAAHGFYRLVANPLNPDCERMLVQALRTHSRVLMQTTDEMQAICIEARMDMARALGRLGALLRTHADTMMVIGGDTLQAVLAQAEIHCLTAEGEAFPGVAVCQVKGRRLLTKSGGFGEADILVRLAESK